MARFMLPEQASITRAPNRGCIVQRHRLNRGGDRVANSASYGSHQPTLIHKETAWCDYNGDDAILADRWEGGGISAVYDASQYDCLDSPQSGYRDRYEIGGYFRKCESRAAKVGVAIDAGPVNLGATSGYSSRVDMDWRAVRAYIYICGSNAYPRDAQIVYTY